MNLPDYYAILEVSHTSTPEELGKAFKRLALKWHPDRNPHPQATERTREIIEAYRLLSDPVKRARYDAYYTATGLKSSAAEEERKADRTRKPMHKEQQRPVHDQELEGWIAEARKWAKENIEYAAVETSNIIKEGIMGGLMNLIGVVSFGLIVWIVFVIASC